MKSLSVLIVIAAIMGLTVEAGSNIYQRFMVSSLQTTPTISGFSPTTGAPGTNVTITGTGFISPSAVRFNGTDAAFTVNSTTEIGAVLPVTATTGLITVIPAGGTATSLSNFVLPPTYTVSGRITDATNNPLVGVMVTFDLDFQGTMNTTSTTTDAAGNYV